MKEIPLYGGPSLQTAKANPGTAARAANGDQGQMLGASIHKAEQGLQGSAEAFARISDFGEMQRQEVELRRIRDESDAEFSKLLSYAPDTKDSVFDKDGSIIKGRLDDLAYKFGQRIDGLGGTFFNPENALKARGVMDAVKSSLPERYWGLAAKHQLSVARQAFEEGLKGDLMRKDYAAASRRAQEAAKAGVISQQKAENLGYGFHQDELMKRAQRLMRKNPSELAFQMDEGLWSKLNEDNLFKVQDELERILRDKAEQLPYTDSELKAIQEGRTVPPKYADLPGDTEKMRVWRQAKREGKLHLYKDDIEAEFRKEIANSPVFDSQSKYDDWKKEMVKDWSDAKTGFGLTPDEVELACDHHIANMMSAGSDDSLNVSKLFADLDQQSIVPAFSQKHEKAKEAWFSRSIKEAAAMDEMNSAMERVKNKAFRTYIAWEQKNTKASREEKFMKATDLISKMSEEEKVSISGDVIQNKSDKKAIYERVFGKMDDYFSDSGKAALDEQKMRHQEYREERAESAKKAAQQRTVEQAKYMPVEVDGVINVSEREPGIYLDRKTFEQVVKAHGNAPVVLATIPERGSRRAAAKLPILGWHEGEGAMLTSGARVRLFGRIRNVNSLQLKFLKNSESKMLEDGKMKEFTEKKKRKALDADAPPDDFGLVPDNGVETAQPVSGTYLNGELTMLPPL